MTELYIFVWTMVLVLITLPALAVALTLLLPRITERAALRLERTPGVSFLVGAVIAGMVALVAFGLGSVVAPALGGAIAVLGLGFYAIGAAGMARLFGERIGSVRGEYRLVRETLLGGIMLELACFVPLVGWFLFFPLVLALNTGAAAFALIGWAPKPQPTPEVDTISPAEMTWGEAK